MNAKDYKIGIITAVNRGSLVAAGFFSRALSLLLLSTFAAVAGPITGANWVALGGGSEGINGNVFAIAIDTNGNVYAGGLFYLGPYTTSSPLYEVAKWDGNSWSGFGVPGAGNEVYALAFDSSGNLYAAGVFPFLAKWDGNTWSTFQSPQFNYALAFDKAGNLYEGCSSTEQMPNGGILIWNGSTYSGVGGGIGYGGVYALAFDSMSNLYAGGSFSTAGGIDAANIAKWDGTNWNALGAGISGSVQALAFDASGNLYAGGYFTNAGNVSANYIAEWNGSSWTNLGSGMNAEVAALAFDNAGNLYAGGSFTMAGGVPAMRVAVWNGSSWSAVGPGMQGVSDVDCIALDKSLAAKAIGSQGLGNLYAGGLAYIVGDYANGIDKILVDGPTPNHLSLANVGASTNVLTFLGSPGSNYVLDLATNLFPPVQWMPQSTNIASTNNAAAAGYVSFTNVTKLPSGFFRTRIAQ